MRAAESLVPRLREVRIDLTALRNNIERLGDPSIDVSIDAYGHGAMMVAREAMAGGVKNFFVRNEAERAMLRTAGLEATISTLRPDGSALGVGVAARAAGLQPVMRVSARVVSLKTVEAGEGVSYGHIWRAHESTTLALVPIGYADGLTRSASNVGFLWLGEALRPIVGRVAMNVCVVDIGAALIKVGDEAVVFGGAIGPSVEDWCGALGISALEVTSAFGNHIQRIDS